MRKLYFIALSGAAISAWGAPVSPEQALARLSSEGPRRIAPKTEHYQLIEQKSYPQLYIFSAGEGYIVLPGDDRAPALLGYADFGAMDLSNPNLAYWLESYNRELTHISAPTTGHRIMRISRPPIQPMTETRWNQEAPYNDLCPELNGTRCVTGCVATALAQVMKYHNYPPKGSGTHSYAWNGGTLSFDYGSTAFEWDKMTNTYTSNSTAEEKNAVATLMYACGVGVNMNYTATESGAISRDMGTALLSYFGYDKGLQILNREYYGLSDWEEIIYTELNEGRPVLYGGQGSAGGHQFVCDGYSADGYFHFNWGWGGMSDGYFLLTALDPPALGVGGGAGGFNYNQNIMTGVQPPTAENAEAYLFYSSGFGVGSPTVALGSDAIFGSGFYNYGYFATPEGTRLGVKFEASDGSGTTYASTDYGVIEPEYGLRQISVKIPSDLKPGTYTVTPVYQIPGRDPEVMHAPLSGNTRLTATVSGTTMTFSAPDAAKITVGDLRLETALYWDTTCKVSFTITNSGESEFYDGLIPVLISADGQSLVAQGATYPVDIQPGATENGEYVGTFSAETAPAAGSYLLGICNSAGQLVCEPIAVTLNSAPANTTLEVSGLRILSGNPYTGSGEAKFEFTAKCVEGYYADRLTVAIFTESGGAAIASGSTEVLYIAAGESQTVTADVDLGNPANGNYMAVVFKGNTQLSEPAYFRVDTSLSIADIATHESGPYEVCDLQGRHVVNPHPGTLYIINGKKVIF